MDERHYDRWSPAEAARYDEFAAQSFSWLYIERPSLQALIRPCIGQRTVALDLGCGGGRIIDLRRDHDRQVLDELAGQLPRESASRMPQWSAKN
jgi:hypothetical protein